MVGSYILQEVGVMCALMVLCIVVFEVNNLNNSYVLITNKFTSLLHI